MPAAMFSHADSQLTINLDAILANWRRLDSLSPAQTATAAMVKANGYGLGAARIGTMLAAAGCRHFFVASLSEAIDLAAAFRETGHNEAAIMVLHGVQRGQEADFAAAGLVPVLNDLEQLARWRMWATKAGQKLPALLHFDTGMTRLGLDAAQTDWLIDTPQALDGLDIRHIMSHLVAAEVKTDPINDQQRDRFNAIRQFFPGLPASLANSAGCFLGSDYHFQMTRPGIALYGIHPAGRPGDGLQPVLRWCARIMQVRAAAAGDKVGYNGTVTLQRDSRIATIGVGYADGYRRQLGGKASVRIGSATAPVIGRVSMDSITVDVTDLTADDLATGQADLLHDAYDIHTMAIDAGTIGYEIITQLGHRPARQFIGGPEPDQPATP